MQDNRSADPSDQIGRAKAASEQHRQIALRLNQQAGQIRSEADATVFVEGAAQVLSDSIPEVWASQELLGRVARAEYRSATDTASLLSEEDVVRAWNGYVREIGAGDEAILTTRDLHALRELKHASAESAWSRGYQTIWTMPNIYAVATDGAVAQGCRAVEMLAVLHDIDALFQNLRTARKVAAAGIITRRRRLDEQQERRSSAQVVVRSRADDNPVRAAEKRYIEQRGIGAYYEVLQRLANELLPASPRG
jgi:hypothetical protein